MCEKISHQHYIIFVLVCLQRFLLNIWWKMGSALHHNFICGIIRAGNILISDAISHLTNKNKRTSPFHLSLTLTANIVIIIITRPKPANGPQGLAGSWGQETDEVSTFLVFLTSHFAPAALSSDLINLGPLMTMKIHLETLKTIETNQKP